MAHQSYSRCLKCDTFLRWPQEFRRGLRVCKSCVPDASTEPEPLRQSIPWRSTGCFVYLFFDDADQVLYVGVTEDLIQRVYQHRRIASWAKTVARVEWRELESRTAALTEEARLIRLLAPLYNIAGNVG